MINDFVCVNVGDKYSDFYVDALYAGIKRNTEQDFKFWCITDRPRDVNPEIAQIIVDDELTGWWAKLHLFNAGLSLPHKVIFFDLDTIIIKTIDALRNCYTLLPLATLDEFGNPSHWASGVMIMDRAELFYLWQYRHNQNGFHGDQDWLEHHAKGKTEHKFLQDILPDGYFVSYKEHNLMFDVPGDKTHVVCFHGTPKQHECDHAWVKNNWVKELSLKTSANTSENEIKSNIKSFVAYARGNGIKLLSAHWGFDQTINGTAYLVAGGASLEQDWIKLLQAREGDKVFACNGSIKWLNQRGLVPDYGVIADSRFENLQFMQETQVAHWLLASNCNISLLHKAHLSGAAVNYYHGMAISAPEALNELGLNEPVLSAGSTVGLKQFLLAVAMGFRKIVLIGYDGCITENKLHAYHQNIKHDDRQMQITIGAKSFLVTPWLAYQAQEWAKLIYIMRDLDIELQVNDDTLIGHIAKVAFDSTNDVRLAA